jgi:hypothetical protein
MKPMIDHLLLVRCDWEIHRHLCGMALKKVKAEAILCVLCVPVSIFGTHLARNLWYPSLSMIISLRAVQEICGNSHERSEVVKRRHSLWTRPSLTTNGRHFALHREHLLAHLWTSYTIVLLYLNALYFRRQPRNSRCISAALIFSVRRKYKTTRISQLAGLSIAGHMATLCRDKNKH